MMNKARDKFDCDTDWNHGDHRYRFDIMILREANGEVSVIALNLPGVASFGGSEDEALHNFREAASGVLESFLEDGEEIPWKAVDAADICPGAKRKAIIVTLDNYAGPSLA